MNTNIKENCVRSLENEISDKCGMCGAETASKGDIYTCQACGAEVCDCCADNHSCPSR